MISEDLNIGPIMAVELKCSNVVLSKTFGTMISTLLTPPRRANYQLSEMSTGYISKVMKRSIILSAWRVSNGSRTERMNKWDRFPFVLRKLTVANVAW